MRTARSVKIWTIRFFKSALFLILAAILVLALRKNQGRIRYWVWLTASLKFLIPFSLLIALGSHIAKPRVSTPTQAVVYSAVEDFSQPFAGPETPSFVPTPVVQSPTSVGDTITASSIIASAKVGKG